MVDEDRILARLKEKRIVIEGHFRLRSKLHSDKYVTKIVDPLFLSELGKALAYKTYEQVSDIDTVIAPAVGGVALAHSVAGHLADLYGCDVMAVFAEKEKVLIPDPEGEDRLCYAETGAFTIPESWRSLITGRNILVVDDTVTSGGSLRKVVEAVRRRQGRVLAVGVICNRGQVKEAAVGNPPHLVSLVCLKTQAWKPGPEKCPLCKQGIPINPSVGYGRGFAVHH